MALKIKPEYSGTIIGFNKSCEPLGQRSQKDLDFLYKRALSRNNKAWLAMFEEVDIPSEKEIEALKEKEFIDKQNRKHKQASAKNTEEPN